MAAEEPLRHGTARAQILPHPGGEQTALALLGCSLHGEICTTAPHLCRTQVREKYSAVSALMALTFEN